jgi:hypothetical protein
MPLLSRCALLRFSSTRHCVSTHRSLNNKKAEEDAQKATEKQLEDIKQIGEKTGPKV